MRRREFVTSVLGGAFGLWPAVLHGQPARSPVIGFLGLTTRQQWDRYLASFLDGLRDQGFVDRQNVTVEYRWAEGQYQQLKAMAAELVAQRVNVIVAIAPPAAQAAKAATSDIPIVFFLGSDPVQQGLVASLSRPGGNITGASALSNSLNGKRLELLRQIVRPPAAIGLLVNPTNSNVKFDTAETKRNADAVGQVLVVAEAADDAGIDSAFAEFARQKAAAVIVNPDPFLLARHDKVVALAAKNRMATIFHVPDPVLAGGLMSYGASFTEAHRLVGNYAGRILKGEKPSDLPVPQPTKFELTINVKTAKALGLEVPQALLTLADNVIE